MYLCGIVFLVACCFLVVLLAFYLWRPRPVSCGIHLLPLYNPQPETTATNPRTQVSTSTPLVEGETLIDFPNSPFLPSPQPPTDDNNNISWSEVRQVYQDIGLRVTSPFRTSVRPSSETYESIL